MEPRQYSEGFSTLRMVAHCLTKRTYPFLISAAQTTRVATQRKCRRLSWMTWWICVRETDLRDLQINIWLMYLCHNRQESSFSQWNCIQGPWDWRFVAENPRRTPELNQWSKGPSSSHTTWRWSLGQSSCEPVLFAIKSLRCLMPQPNARPRMSCRLKMNPTMKSLNRVAWEGISPCPSWFPWLSPSISLISSASLPPGVPASSISCVDHQALVSIMMWWSGESRRQGDDL